MRFFKGFESVKLSSLAKIVWRQFHTCEAFFLNGMGGLGKWSKYHPEGVPKEIVKHEGFEHK